MVKPLQIILESLSTEFTICNTSTSSTTSTTSTTSTFHGQTITNNSEKVFQIHLSHILHLPLLNLHLHLHFTVIPLQIIRELDMKPLTYEAVAKGWYHPLIAIEDLPIVLAIPDLKVYA